MMHKIVSFDTVNTPYAFLENSRGIKMVDGKKYIYERELEHKDIDMYILPFMNSLDINEYILFFCLYVEKTIVVSNLLELYMVIYCIYNSYKTI